MHPRKPEVEAPWTCACQFTALAFGDLDDDFLLLSTYRVTGTLDETNLSVSAVEWSYPCR